MDEIETDVPNVHTILWELIYPWNTSRGSPPLRVALDSLLPSLPASTSLTLVYPGGANHVVAIPHCELYFCIELS